MFSRTLLLVVVAAVAVCAQHDSVVPSAEVMSEEAPDMALDEVVPERLVEDVDDVQDDFVQVGLSSLDIIQSLKAYSEAAIDKAADFGASDKNALVALIEALGTTQSKCKKVKGLTPRQLNADAAGIKLTKAQKDSLTHWKGDLLEVAATTGKHDPGSASHQYHLAMKKVGAVYSGGLGKYLLSAVAGAVGNGKDVVAVLPKGDDDGPRRMVGFDAATLGLHTEPSYFKTLAIPEQLYSNRLVAVMACDVEAAKKEKARIKELQEKAEEKAAKKEERAAKVVEKAKKAEIAAEKAEKKAEKDAKELAHKKKVAAEKLAKAQEQADKKAIEMAKKAEEKGEKAEKKAKADEKAAKDAKKERADKKEKADKETAAKAKKEKDDKAAAKEKADKAAATAEKNKKAEEKATKAAEKKQKAEDEKAKKRQEKQKKADDAAAKAKEEAHKAEVAAEKDEKEKKAKKDAAAEAAAKKKEKATKKTEEKADKAEKKQKEKDTKKAQKLYLSITTFDQKSAGTNSKPTVKVIGTKGSWTGKITPEARGKSTMLIYDAGKDLGKITSVNLKAADTDGWKIKSFRVRVGEGPFVWMGCLPFWLDGKPYDKGTYSAPHKDTLTLKPGICDSMIAFNKAKEDEKNAKAAKAKEIEEKKPKYGACVCEVKVYGDNTYKGNALSTKRCIGHASDASRSCRWTGMANWKIHSVLMNKHCRQIEVEDNDANWDKHDTKYSKSNPDLPWDLEADVLAIKIWPKTETMEKCCVANCPHQPCEGVVQIYQHNHYGGWEAKFFAGSYTLATARTHGFVNDDATSMKVPKNCKVISYQHGNLNGKKAIIPAGNHDYASLRQYGFTNDDMSSLKVVDAN